MTDHQRVLVADDDEASRTVLTDALATEGYEVVSAADGHEALTQLRRCQPDLIVLDLLMPGMDGQTFRASQRALGLAGSVPIVVLSAVPAAELAARAAEMGAAAALPKPFELDALLETVDRLTRHRAA